jgi:pimeloyl-ACP methyl ester carboxylesterase
MMEELFLQDGKICVRKNEFLPDRATLVFIHGVSGNLGAWAPYEEAFQNTHNVLFYDLRGHGKSYRYPREDDYAISSFADDLEYIITFFGLQNVVLVAHSAHTNKTPQSLEHSYCRRVCDSTTQSSPISFE